MSFISFSDQWEVLIDDQGNPLIGRLSFLDYNTSQLKLVYQDINNTIEASNPQYTDATGKLINQIYLGSGTYKVKFERYIGSGDMMDPINAEDDSLWFQYKIENINGLPSTSSTGGETQLIINTIAELRTIDPNVYPNVKVLGYYDKTDKIASREYIWSSSDTRQDNYGTIIQRTGVNTGRWNMQEPEEMDSRYFGVFPSLTETYNSQLASLISWMSSSHAKCKSIRFSTGTYTFITGTFTFISKIIIEKDVKFAISGNGSLNININADYDIQTQNPLVVDSAALSNVIISFGAQNKTLNNVVKSFWYGNWENYSGGDDASLVALASRVGKNYIIHITNTYYAKSGTTSFNQNIEFYNGQISTLGGIVTFNGSTLSAPESTAVRLVTGTGGSYSNFRFTNGSRIKSSLFNSVALNLILNGIQFNSYNSYFDFDSNVTFTDSFTDTGAFTFSHSGGLITANTSEQYAIFNSFETSDSGQKFSGNDVYVGIKNQEVKITWFIPTNPSNIQLEYALKNSLRCACKGSGSLDLCNYNIPMANGFTISSVDSSLQSIKIHDGKLRLDNTSSAALIIFTASGENIQFKNVDINTNNSAYTEVLRLAGSSFFSNVEFDTCNSYVNSQTVLFSTVDTASCNWFRYNNGYSRGGKLIYNPKALSVQISNNYYFASKVYAAQSRPIFQNNYCESAGEISLKSLNSAIITGNRFFETSLFLYDNNGIIDGVINSNQFETTNNAQSKIGLIGVTPGTLFNGLSIVGNSFTGNYNSIMIAIYANGSFAGLNHKLNISNNICPVFNIKVPQTVGSSRNISWFTTVGSNVARLYMTGNPENSYNIFIIPGAEDPFDYIASTINHGIISALYYTSTDGNRYQECSTAALSQFGGFNGSRTTWSIYNSWAQ